jgi:hypothetical protein
MSHNETSVGSQRRSVVCFARAMNWTRDFPVPIVLRDGRTIATLGDARALMLAFPESRRAAPPWNQAVELLMRAAGDRGTGVDISAAAKHLKIMLKAEGLT